MAATEAESEQLQEAFRAFNQHSGDLEESYRDLRDTVDSLTRRLRLAQTGRLVQLVQKERLAQRLSHLLETLPGGIIVIDGGGIVQESNSQATALLHQPLRGCSWSTIVRREFCAGGTEDGDLQLQSGRWLCLSRRSLQHEPGEILLLSDVTNGRRMSELRQRQERLGVIGEMTAEFAHQVRTPLASAKLYAAQLDSPSPEQKRIANKISARLDDLGRMVNDMLGFAAGAVAVQESVAVPELLHDVVDSIQTQMREHTTLRVSVAYSGLRVAANKDALKGALHNLISNAEQACAEPAIVTLTGFYADGHVHLRVSDNGNGIPDDVLPRLFEPFFTTRPQGTGLGLAVVQAVAKAHDGHVDVTTSDKGAAITMRLPSVLQEIGVCVDD